MDTTAIVKFIQGADEEGLIEISDAIKERSLQIRIERGKDMVEKLRIGFWVKDSLGSLGKVIGLTETAVTIDREGQRKKTILFDEIKEIFEKKPEVEKTEEEEAPPVEVKEEPKKKGFGRK